MSGSGGGGGLGGFVEDAWDSATGFAKDAWEDFEGNEFVELAEDTARGALSAATFGGSEALLGEGWDPWGLTGGLLSGGMGTAALATGATSGALQHAHEKAIMEPRRAAEQAKRQEILDAERAHAAAIAALPKDPTVEEIQRQRRATGGRRGTILTAPGQSLGSVGQGKNLLGL